MNAQAKSSNGNGNGNGVTSGVPQSQAASLMEPYLVKLILTHVLPHLDEAVAIWLIRKFGLAAFLGADKAEIKFVERAPNAPALALQKAGYLYIGLCEGAGLHSVDEHRRVSETAPDGRVPGECAATLAAKRAGLTPNEHPSLWHLLMEVYRCDSKGGVRYTQLAEIMKLLGRVRKGGSEEVLKLLFPVLDAIVLQHTMSFTAVPEEMSLSEIFSKYLAKYAISDKRIIKDIEDRIIESQQRTDGSVTDLAYVVQAMYRTGCSVETITHFCFMVFEAWHYDQVEFYEVLPVIDRSLKKLVRVKLSDNKEVGMLAVVVRSDSYSALRAANYRQHRFVVIENSEGNVQVFVNGKVSNRVSLNNFVGMVRLLETPAGERGALKARIHQELIKAGVSGLETPQAIAEACWNRLCQTKGEYQVDNWYYHYTKDGVRALLNGSHTHRARPTSRKLDILVDALVNSHHPGLTARWMRDIGDPFGLFRAVTAQATGPKPVLRVVARPAAPVHSNAPIGDDVAQAVEADLGQVFDRAGTDEVATT